MHKKEKSKLLITGIIVIIIGIMIGIIPIFLQRKVGMKEKNKVEDYIRDTSTIEDNNSINEEEENSNEEEYLFILEIPRINIKRGIYQKSSSLNTIEKNITIMKESSLPTDNNGNVVLEAHNGTANVAFFKYLYKLEINDPVYIYYQGTKYIYNVSNIYDVDKDGTVEVNRDSNQKTLTLITCKKDTDDKQLVVILYLSKEENY